MYIQLSCRTDPSESFNWYHTLDPDQAGINGTLINKNENPYSLSSLYGHNSQLIFTVSNNTTGFYWCVINKMTMVPLRPGTVIQIRQNYSSSLSKCTPIGVNDQHNYVPECADANVTSCGLNCTPEPSFSSTVSTTSQRQDVRSTTLPSDSLIFTTTLPSSLSTITTIYTPLISSSSSTSTLLTSSLSITIQTSTSTPIPLIVSTPMPTATEPILNIGPSPTATSQSQILLYSLIGICILLAIIALIIAIAIIILCCMTRRQHSLGAATPKGTTNYV